MYIDVISVVINLILNDYGLNFIVSVTQWPNKEPIKLYLILMNFHHTLLRSQKDSFRQQISNNRRYLHKLQVFPNPQSKKFKAQI